MGGLLSNPADKFSWFDVPLFRRYPYLLPCVTAAAIAWAGCLYGYFYLGEVCPQQSPLIAGTICSFSFIMKTLPTKRWQHKEDIQMSDCHSGAFEKPPQPASIRYLLSIPLVRALCLSGAGLSFM